HRLGETDAANGFVNRFLWICARRSKLLPDGGKIPDFNLLLPDLKEAVRRAQACEQIGRDDEARTLWHQVYASLTAERPGALGNVSGRGEPQVLRLSLLYALLDGEDTVRKEHLQAALALWAYVERSCAWIFGEGTGDRDADDLLDALRAARDKGMTRKEISAF